MNTRHESESSVPPEFRLDRREFLKLSTLFLGTLWLSKYIHLRGNESGVNAKKILLVTDVHAKKWNAAHPDNNMATPSMRYLFKILQYAQFDHVYQLGDMFVRGTSDSDTLDNLKSNLQTFRILRVPQTHLIGNHEMWDMNIANIAKTYREMGLDDRFYGMHDYGNFRIVFLDLLAEPGNFGRLPAERIDWLRKVLDPKIPSVILCHEGFIQSPHIGNNPYYADQPSASILANGPAAWEEIKDLFPKAVVSGHIHTPDIFMADRTLMYTAPAFCEPETFGAFTVLNMSGDHGSLNSISFTGKILQAEF
jgi:hypothetical protein